MYSFMLCKGKNPLSVVLKMSFKEEKNCGDNLMQEVVSLYSLIYPLGPNYM